MDGGVFRVTKGLIDKYGPDFSTGYGTRYDPAAFRDAPYLSKPFEPENLWSAITAARRQHLQSARYSAT